MKIILVLFTVYCIGFCDETLYTNKIMDAQLAEVSEIFKMLKRKYLTIGDVEVSDDIKAYGVKLGDITKIQRKGDAVLTVADNELVGKGGIGIDKMGLLMDSIDFNDLLLSDITGVMLYSRPQTKINATQQFIKEVVPFVNKKLASSAFKEIIEKYLDPCNKTPKDDMYSFFMNWMQDYDEEDTNDISKLSEPENPSNDYFGFSAHRQQHIMYPSLSEPDNSPYEAFPSVFHVDN